MQTEVFLSDVQVSKMLSKSPQSLRNERQQGRGLPYYKLGKSVRYKLSEVLKFVEGCRIDPAAGGGK